MGLLSLLVCAYLLGPTGALLALPLTIALRRVLHDAELPVSWLGLESPGRPDGVSWRWRGSC